MYKLKYSAVWHASVITVRGHYMHMASRVSRSSSSSSCQQLPHCQEGNTVAEPLEKATTAVESSRTL